MDNRQEYDFFMDELLSRSVEEFKKTEESKLLQEKLDRMDCDCETMFTKAERSFATECFEVLLEVSGQEEKYVYRKGFRDCVLLLKTLGILM